MIVDSIKVTGELCIRRYNEAGELTLERFEKNLVVTTGKTFIAGRIAAAGTPGPMTHMAIGAPSFVLAPLPSDVSLTTEIARVTISPAGGSASGNKITYVGLFSAGVGTNSSITEAGIFSSSIGGNMFCRTTFPAVNKTASDSIVIVWVITIS